MKMLDEKAMSKDVINVKKSFEDIFKGIREFNNKIKPEEKQVVKDIINKSEKLCRRNKNIKKEMILINELAKEWDNSIVEEPNQEIKRTHYFLLSKNGAQSISARILNADSPPDERIIEILLDKASIRLHNKRKRVLSILHEVGHYIGRRHRVKVDAAGKPGEKTRMDYYYELIASELCNQFHRNAISKKTGIPLDKLTLNIELDKNIDMDSKELSYNLRESLRQKYQTVLKDIKKLYEETDADEQITNDQKAKDAFDAGYFQYVEPHMRKSIKNYLSRTDNALVQIEEEWKKKGYNIENSVEAIRKDLARRNINMDNPWMESRRLLLQEIAADVFMMRISCIEPQQYAEFIIDATIDLLCKKKIPLYNLPLVLSNSVIVPRIVAVCLAVKKENDNEQFFTQYPVISTERSKAKSKGMQLVEYTMYEYRKIEKLKDDDKDKQIQNIFNPLYDAVQYAQSISYKNEDEYLEGRIKSNIHKKIQKYIRPWYIKLLDDFVKYGRKFFEWLDIKLMF